MARRRHILRITLVLLSGWLCAGPGPMTPAGTTGASGATARAPGVAVSVPGKDDSAPVPVPEPDFKAVRYLRSGNGLWCVRAAWDLIVPALMLFSGFSARLRGWAERAGRPWLVSVAIYIAAFVAAIDLFEFPLDYYEGFVRAHAYGLSNQSFGRWLGQSLKGLCVDLAGCVSFLWIPYMLMRMSPRRWWLYTWIAGTGAAAFFVLITPVWVDPLFNHFGPLKDRALEADIRALASRAGIRGSRIYQVDKSADTDAVNAYMTGILGTKRIVLWDTLIARLDRRELLTVVGHEIGHYKLGHVRRALLLGSALALFALYLFHRFSGRWIVRFRERFRFDRLSDIASLPLVLFCFGAANLALSPLALAYSRHVEREADRFALEITRDNHAAAMAEVKLQSANLNVPRPGLFYELFRATHPASGERIEFANTYRPWRNGEPLKYERLFSAPGRD